MSSKSASERSSTAKRNVACVTIITSSEASVDRINLIKRSTLLRSLPIVVKLFLGLTYQSKGKPCPDKLTLAKDLPIERSGTAIIAFFIP